MHVEQILARKGTTVATITPGDSVTAAVEALAQHGVGALVVSTDGSAIDGIVSERDIVRAIARADDDLMNRPVESIMTKSVWTCVPSDSVEDLMGRMTEHRIRHLPVERDGRLAGIISIGDVVKWRVSQLEEEARQLQGYIQNTGYN